jgi:MYXO-CTERM domain-containing protein
LTSGTCGCQADVDCGGLVSGRICDATVHKCTVGCRGSGGNGCPVELTCTSSSATPGQCTTPSDGGADGAGGDGASGGDGGVDSSDGSNGGDGASGDSGGGADGADGAGNDGTSGGDGSSDLSSGDGALPGDTLTDANRDGLDGAGDGSATGDLLADRADALSSDVARDGSGDGISGDGTSGDGPLADGSGGDAGPRTDATPDQPFGDAAINGRILNLAGGGCDCATAPAIPAGWSGGLFLLLAAGLIRRRRR